MPWSTFKCVSVSSHPGGRHILYLDQRGLTSLLRNWYYVTSKEHFCRCKIIWTGPDWVTRSECKSQGEEHHSTHHSKYQINYFAESRNSLHSWNIFHLSVLHPLPVEYITEDGGCQIGSIASNREVIASVFREVLLSFNHLQIDVFDQSPYIRTKEKYSTSVCRPRPKNSWFKFPNNIQNGDANCSKVE